MSDDPRPILALSGGVGGAKLALGLADVLAPGRLHVLVNTADDFNHLGLHISPDIDTLVYTLAGLASREQGWGLEGETWQALDALKQLGGETWFQLGDRDLATHLWRTQQLQKGLTLSEITSEMAIRLGISSRIYPMSNDAVRTMVSTADGELPFQQYFVRERCAPAVSGFRFDGIAQAQVNPEVRTRLQQDAFAAVIVCPSNPFVSIDPILQLPGLCQALLDTPSPVALVSPIVGGIAIKGPAAKMMSEMGLASSAVAVAQHYSQVYPGLIDHFVIDETDATLADEVREMNLDVAVTDTMMNTRADKQRLARFIMNLTQVTH
ncbi:MAG: 2-phospho-L-lactate transferase [Pseudomonadota bacterium]